MTPTSTGHTIVDLVIVAGLILGAIFSTGLLTDAATVFSPKRQPAARGRR